jgi:hypothetical protein
MHSTPDAHHEILAGPLERLRPPAQVGDPLVSRLGIRSPASISRYSRTLTPTSQAARQTRSPSRFRSCCCIIDGNAASPGMTELLDGADVTANRAVSADPGICGAAAARFLNPLRVRLVQPAVGDYAHGKHADDHDEDHDPTLHGMDGTPTRAGL